jgi:hypothetical protein
MRGARELFFSFPRASHAAGQALPVKIMEPKH